MRSTHVVAPVDFAPTFSTRHETVTTAGSATVKVGARTLDTARSGYGASETMSSRFPELFASPVLEALSSAN